MKIKIYAIGKIKENYLKIGIDDYLKKIKPYSQIEIVEVNDEPVRDNPNDSEINLVKNKEGQKVLKLLKDNDYVIIHDAVRPLLPQLTLNKMIDTAIEKGNACLAVPCYETVICTEDGKSGDKEIDRNSFLRVQTPQMYRYGLIRELYEKAEKDNLHNFVYANTLAIHYGTRIYFSDGFNCNYKITTKDDIPLYKALLKFSEEELARR